MDLNDANFGAKRRLRQFKYGDNWQRWKMNMEFYLMSKGSMYDLVVGTKEATTQADRITARQAFGLIGMLLDPEYQIMILQEDNVNKAWTVLCKHFEKENAVGRIRLLCEFFFI